MTQQPTNPPQRIDALRHEISDRYEDLSARLQQVARFAINHPNDMALEVLTVLAERAGVYPSTLVRFAKAFGYGGFREMQQIFQQQLLEQSQSYEERIRIARATEDLDGVANGVPGALLGDFASANAAALSHLRETMKPEVLEKALDILDNAREIGIIGLRRTFPVAAYFGYVLGQSGVCARLLDGMGGMLRQQSAAFDRNDALIAVSFHPYAPETMEVVQAMHERGVPCVVMSESVLSPLARYATAFLEVQDAETHGFRSLTATLCLAQTLAISLLYRRQVMHRHDLSAAGGKAVPQSRKGNAQ